MNTTNQIKTEMKDIMKDFKLGKVDLKSLLNCDPSSIIEYGDYLCDNSSSIKNLEFLLLANCCKDFNLQIMLSVINQPYEEISKLVEFIILEKLVDSEIKEDVDKSKFCCFRFWWIIEGLFVGPASISKTLLKIYDIYIDTEIFCDEYLSEEQMENVFYFTSLLVYYSTKLKLKGFLSTGSLETFLNNLDKISIENNIREKILKYLLEFSDMGDDKKYLKIIMKYNLTH